MRKGKKIPAIVFCGVAFCTFVSCERTNIHTHTYKYYTVKEATCAEKGVLEVLCEACGEKHYEDIERKAHILVDGKCTVCGEDEADETILSDEGSKAFYTLDDIYAEIINGRQQVSKEEFLEIAAHIRISKLYVNKVGAFHATFNGQTSINFGKVNKEFVLSTTLSETVYQVDIAEGILSATCANGTHEEIGAVKGLASGENPIVGITLNRQNQLIVLFENDSVRSLGQIAETAPEMDKSALIYNKTSTGYEVFAPVDKNIQTVEILPTHGGSPITAIDVNAFAGCTKLQSVVIEEGIGKIFVGAFANCAVLEEITLPASLRLIGMSAFRGCTRLKKIYYGGTAEEWENLRIAIGNDCLLAAQVVFVNEG